MKYRNRLNRIKMSSLVLCILTYSCMQILPVQAWRSREANVASEVFASSLPLVASGIPVEVPETAAKRLGLDKVEMTQPLSDATQQRIEATMASMLPCWHNFVDNVFVIRHPESAGQSHAGVRDHFLAATVSVDMVSPISRQSSAEPMLNLYLYLPDDLLDGSGLDTPLTNTNIVPYAAAPIPQTLGDFLDWTLFHESWHLLDLDARLQQHIRSRQTDQIQDVMADPQEWQIAFPELTVGQHLGWLDMGEQFLLSDELEGTRTTRSGATSYQYDLGTIGVAYDDGEYMFQRGLQRSGYLPDELQQLTDLSPLLQGGAIPTIYSLFNSSDERFAEYGAWFLFTRQSDTEQAFQNLFPALHHSYDLRLQAAHDRCQPEHQAVKEVLSALPWRRESL